VHSESKKWYEGTSNNLSDEEKAWINTQDILNGNFKPKGHAIYRNIHNALQVKDISLSMNDVAFMNGFQRPAK
jgi:hypothetical protein